MSEHSASLITRGLSADYNPVEHLIDAEGQRHIAAIPDAPDRLLRWFPHQGIHGRWFTNTQEAEVRANQQQEHLAVLRSTGLQIPEIHDTFVGYGPDDQEIRVFNVVQLVKRLSQLRNKEHKAEVQSKVGRYLAWVMSTDQPIVLHDIFAAYQFRVWNDRPGLIDVDPYFALVRDNMGRPSATMGHIREFLRSTG